jgi:peptide chain release factor 2
MQPHHKLVQHISQDIRQAFRKLSIDQKRQERDTLRLKLEDPKMWESPEEAQQMSKKVAHISHTIDFWLEAQRQLDETTDLLALEDSSIENECGIILERLQTDIRTHKSDLLFTGEFDDHNAILRITAGVGGTDAQDWAEMLERMYLRWAEKNTMSSSLIERSKGEEAGIKTSVIEIEGSFAYGKLRSEHGVHRLVRLSPFNSDNLRQTSFALVEVLPQIDAPEEVKLEDKDLKIDVYRAGGHGGQSVNTTDSAVRITHLPTNISVAIQNERSQLQNKETALKILRSKLAQLKIEQHAEKIDDLRAGESANWGSQIRNYVLHPYTMVKDMRTKHEERDAKKVLDGEITHFITAYLEA